MVVIESLFGEDAAVLRNRHFQLLLLASVSSPLGSALVSPVLDSLTGPLGVGEARIGLIMAVFTAPAIVAIPLSGLLADRYGRKPILITGLLLFGITGVAVGFTTSFRAVLVLRFLQGIGYTGIGPILIASVGDLYEGSEEATAQGLRFMVVGLSFTLLPPIAGLLVTTSWRLPFLLYAVAIPSAVLVYAFFDEPTAGTNGTDGNGADEQQSDGRLAALLALVRRPRVLAILLARTTPSLVWFGFLTYNSIVVVRLLGGTPGQAGLFVAIASIASSGAATQVGRLVDRLDDRYALLVIAHIVSSAGLAGFALAPSLPVAAAAVFVIGLGFGVLITVYRSTITGLASRRVRGSLVSLGESIGRGGSTLAPILMGAAVALLSPTAGLPEAVRVTVFGVSVASGLLGSAGVLVARASASVGDSVPAAD